MRNITCGIALFAALLLMASPVSALTTASGTNVSQTGEVKDMYMAGGTSLDLQGSYGSDVYSAGNTVTITGPVNGDVTVGAATVTVDAEVKGGVRILGGTAIINSKVGGNVVLLGGTLKIDTNADIAGEVIVAGGTLVINGRVAGAVNAWAGTATINGTIDGPVFLHLDGETEDGAPALHLQQKAVLKGDLTYWAVTDATIDAGATVSGTTKRNESTMDTKDLESFARGIVDIVKIWNLFSALVVGVLIALLFPRTLRTVADMMLKRSGASVGWGVLIALAFPLAFILMMMTVIGIPLAFLLLAGYIVTFYVSQVFLGFLIGTLLVRWLGKRRAPQDGVQTPRMLAPVWLTLLGMVVASLVLDFLFGYLAGFAALLSFLFGIIKLFLSIWTFGAILVVLSGNLRDRELK